MFWGEIKGSRGWTGVFALRFGLLVIGIGAALAFGATRSACSIGLSLIMPDRGLRGLARPARDRPDAPALAADDPSWERWNPWLAREEEPRGEDETHDLPRPRALDRCSRGSSRRRWSRALLLLLAGVLVRRRFATADGGVVPDEGVTLRNVLEVLVEWLAGMARERMGPNWRKYFPLVGTMFFFILVSNLMGLSRASPAPPATRTRRRRGRSSRGSFYTVIGVMEHS